MDEDALTYTVADEPSHGTLSGATPNLIYTPNADYNGLDSFTFKVNDGELDSNIVKVSINVWNVVIPGDIDDSGTIDLHDAILALKMLVGISSNDTYFDADVNGDGKIGLEEVIYILQKVSGLR